jgi:hypothetical protein
MLARSLLSLILFTACASSMEPKTVCLPPPMTVAFRNSGQRGVALVYGKHVYALPPRGRVELLYSAKVYRVEADYATLPPGPYDEFGTLHVEVRSGPVALSR